MVKDYLEKIRQEYIEHKVSLEEQISSYENKVKENTKFLQVLEKETNPGYEAFSPREFNSFHKEKMEELRADQKRISNEIMCLRDQMQEYEFRIADIINVFEAQVYVLTKDEGGRHTPFFSNYRPQFYFRTTDVTGIITLPEGTEMCMPGDNVMMHVELLTPVAMEEGLRFAIREGGRTVGSGVVGKIIE